MAALATLLTGALPASGISPLPPGSGVGPGARLDEQPQPGPTTGETGAQSGSPAAPTGTAPDDQQSTVPSAAPSNEPAAVPSAVPSGQSGARPSIRPVARPVARPATRPVARPDTLTRTARTRADALTDTGAEPAGTRARAAEPPSYIQGDPRTFGASIFSGYAFDTCRAPSLATMQAWRKSSPYGAAGVYIGGRGRACPQQPNLTPSWVKSVHRLGWKLLPLYVGSQAPCVGASHKHKAAMTHKAPYQRGQREGTDAVQQAKRLGMAAHSALYLDMEAYDHGNAKCADTTLRFIQGWNSAVRKLGYVAGFYSSSNAGIAHLERARAAGKRGLPTAMWFARWNVPASVQKEARLHPLSWQPHRRIHQFTGNVKRSYGGRTLNVDQNLVDAPVAVIT